MHPAVFAPSPARKDGGCGGSAGKVWPVLFGKQHEAGRSQLAHTLDDTLVKSSI